MVPTATTFPERGEFATQQYGYTQVDPEFDTHLPGCAYAIPYYSNNYFCMRNLSVAGAAAKGFTAANAPGHEHLMSACDLINFNDVEFSPILDESYNFSYAMKGVPYKHLELVTDDIIQPLGSAENFLFTRKITGIAPNVPLAVNGELNQYDEGSQVHQYGEDIEHGAHYSSW